MRLVCAAVLSTIAVAAPGSQVFRARADAVSVDALVTDGRRPIGGLTAADFEIRDNGVVQKIEALQITEVPFSMMLVLDTSSSMTGRPLSDLKDAARAAIGALHPEDRAALLTFSEVIAGLPWTADKASLDTAIAQLAAGGATSLFDAALAGLIERDAEPGRRHLVIIFSDGVDVSSWLPDYAALDLALRSDVVVYGVESSKRPGQGAAKLRYRSGIRLAPRQPVISSVDFLRELAARTGGEVLTSNSAGLRRTFEQIMSDFRSRYVLSYVPAGVAAEGGHRLDVKLARRSGKVTARRGYQR